MRFDVAQDPHDAIDLAREPAFPLGNLSVRPASREVVNGQQVEALEPRVMQVLVLLARRRGEVVSRDELVASCWDGGWSGDDAVNRCIAKIRRLSESHGGFEVETIARVGYRLSETGTQKAPPAIAPPVRRWPLRRWQSWSLGTRGPGAVAWR
jgi:DNA-binding winged helix-turn-helix (wHTH) protein